MLISRGTLYLACLLYGIALYVIGGVPKGNRRDHNIVRVSSFARKELSWHKRSGIVLVVLVWCDVE